MGCRFNYKKYNQKLHHTTMENKNNSFTNILIPFQRSCSMLWIWSQKRNCIISKNIVLIFHHSIQHNEASGYFYNTLLLKLVNILVVLIKKRDRKCGLILHGGKIIRKHMQSFNNHIIQFSGKMRNLPLLTLLRHTKWL